MPPVVLVEAIAGAYDVAEPWLLRFPGRTLAKVGDTQIAIVAQSGDLDVDPASSDPSWELVARFVHATTDPTILVFRREVVEGATPPIGVSASYAWKDQILLVYRGLDTGAAAVGASSVDVAASANFPAPSRLLTAYSDLYLGIAVVSSAAVAVTAPAGTTSRYANAAGGRALAIFDHLAEAVGATGAKAATTAAPQSGVAASIALAAVPVVGFGLSFTFDPPGAPGLPITGV